jgi:hypothetical protein
MKAWSLLKKLMPMLLVFPALLFAACGSTEDEAPVARVQILHGIEDLGVIEVRIDNKTLGTIEASKLSSAFEVEPGTRSLGIRAQGATSDAFSNTLTLSAQGYLYALTGRLSGNTLKLVAVDQAPPTLANGEAALEVVHLYESTKAFKFDVYAGGALLAQNIGFGDVPSTFVKVAAGPLKLTVFNTGNDPNAALPVVSKDVTVASGSATLLVLQTIDSSLGINTINIK